MMNALWKKIVLILIFVPTAVFASDQELQRTILQVDNLTCRSCLGVIGAQLKRTPGLTGMTADLQKRTVATDHNETITGTQIAYIISKLGYPATVLDEQRINQNEALFFSDPPLTKCETGGCGTRVCNATASAWKELYRRFFQKHQ